MDNRDIRRHSLKNFVYVGDEMEVDSSVLLGMAYRYRHRMKKVPRAIRKQGREAYTQYEDHPISCSSDLGRVAFADNFLYHVSEDASSFFQNVETKSTRSVSGSIVDPNSADGCNIDLSDITVDVAAIPQPSKNYIFSPRCRELALRIFLPLLMLFALPMMNSCKEESDDPITPPNPQPDPTDTIVIPTKEVFIDWGEGTYATLGDISIDSVRGYTKQADVKYVFLNYAPRDTLSSTGYTPDNFDYMINKLKCVIAVDSTKVRGTGIFYVGEGGTSVPDTISNISGMRSRQYEWFRRHGWEARKAMN